jgi:phosphoglycerate dehydrogenase-like enzyme
VNPVQFSGVQLTEMTVGVLGVGRLGKMLCRFAEGFCPRVLGCDLKGVDLPWVEEVDFETLLRESDAISIHIHMLPLNYHLFDRDVFSKMKDNSCLVNTSRGDIIDEAALLDALDSGKLAAFGADVLHDEWREDMSSSPVVRYAQDHDNVILTPHIAGATDTSIWEARVFTARKIAHFLKTGEELTMA